MLLLALLSFSLLSIPAASAGSATVSGILGAGDPSMPVVFISPPNCTGQGVAPVQYEATRFTVDTDGTYTLSLTSAGNFASLYLYAGSFDPTNGTANCVAGDNSAPKGITFGLTAGTAYFVVAFDDTFAQTGGAYSVAISGPGAISLGEAGCDVLMPIPPTAVGATFVANAETYWTPGQPTQPLVILEAGKSVRATGLDATGEYYQIIFECNFLWVKANTLGPNFDNVWNGAPLPTGVVK
jgi:hypothetical protein